MAGQSFSHQLAIAIAHGFAFANFDAQGNHVPGVWTKDTGYRGRPGRGGHSVAQDKRGAVKARGRTRNRLAHR